MTVVLFRSRLPIRPQFPDLVAGYSAGAITALLTACIQNATDDSNLSTAFQANGGLEGNTDLPSPNNSLYAYNARNLSGVFSLAGAVTNLDVLNVTDPPIYAAHGSNDATVPYNSGPAFGTSAHTFYGGGCVLPRNWTD